MTHPGPEYPAAGPARPATEAAWGAPQDAAPAPSRRRRADAKKWASLAGTVVVVGVGAAYTLTGGFGIGDPEVGRLRAHEERDRVRGRRLRARPRTPRSSASRTRSRPRTSSPTTRHLLRVVRDRRGRPLVPERDDHREGHGLLRRVGLTPS